MTNLERAIHAFLTTKLDKPLRDKLSSSDAQSIVKAIVQFIDEYDYKRAHRVNDSYEEELSGIDILEEIKKL